jgi:phosphoribosylformylglycinamidine synthase
MKARILIRLNSSILDVQGKAIEKSLALLGLDDVSGVRVGKLIEIDVPAAQQKSARAFVERLCREVLASPVTENFEIEILEGPEDR